MPVAGLAIAVSLPAATHAQTMQQATTINIRVTSDLAMEETIHVETTALMQSAVDGVAKARWTVVDGQSAELIEAYTRKADGTKIPTDLKDLAFQNGVVGAAASFTDQKINELPFRNVAVGDSTVYTVKFRQKVQYVRNIYSGVASVLPFGAKRTFEMTLRAPASLRIEHDETEIAYDERHEGREIVRHWSASPAHVSVAETDLANLERVVPSLRFSTIGSYDAIAKAYDEVARPKAVATKEIKRLADDVTRDKADARAQAEAIFDWVSRNIRYVAVLFGRGRLMPNELATVLSRRFGDCKDHATLLVALLEAKGIKGEQVLISTDSTYELAATPTLQAFNHVIVYIPALDLYVDPTVEFGSFGRLPTADLGKPVVRISDRGPVMSRTPVPSAENNVIQLTTRIVTGADGRQQGQTTTEARGEFVDLLRRFAAQAESKSKEIALRDLAKQRNIVGEFDLDVPSWTSAGEPYVISTKWQASQPSDLMREGWRATSGLTPLPAAPSLFFGAFDRSKRIFPAGCRAGRAIHDLDLTLPDGISPVRLPAPVSADAPDFSYRRTWSVEGSHIRIRTEVTSNAGSRVCPPEQIDAIRSAYWSIEKRISPRLRFKRSSQPPSNPGPEVSRAAEPDPIDEKTLDDRPE